MIEDVESGKINCIITKDLSRFGREHVMMGYYLEFYFVEKNVRYIAVSDGEDTGVPDWAEIQQDYASGLTRGKVVELGCGHYVHNIRQAQIAEDMKSFLNGYDE